MNIITIISVVGYAYLICDLAFVTPFVRRLKCAFQTLKEKYQIADEDMPSLKLINIKKRGDKQ